MRETHGYAKQGVGYGYNKVKGLNALLGIVSTAVSAPIIVGAPAAAGARCPRLGAPGSSCSDAIAAARRAGAGPVIRCRLDSAFYNHSVIAAISSARAQFSITARMDPAVQKAVAGIPTRRAWVSHQVPEGDLRRRNSSGGSPTRRSPRPPTPRSPPRPASTRSPPG